MAKDPNLCPICGEYIDVLCTAYREKPFINGRKYAAICFSCFDVPKMYQYNEFTKELVVFDTWNPFRLNTVQDMMEDGHSKARAQKSIKAVTRSIKRGNK